MKSKKIYWFIILITILLLSTLFLEGKKLIKPYVEIGSTKIFVELADTEEKRIKGLSGRSFLADNEGMLFIFPQPGFYAFWMPEMNFPIDIIWLNKDKRIIGITANVSNEFNPADPQLYYPPAPVLYVLEVRAGFCAENNLQIGEVAIFHKIGENKR